MVIATIGINSESHAWTQVVKKRTVTYFLFCDGFSNTSKYRPSFSIFYYLCFNPFTLLSWTWRQVYHLGGGCFEKLLFQWSSVILFFVLCLKTMKQKETVVYEYFPWNIGWVNKNLVGLSEPWVNLSLFFHDTLHTNDLIWSANSCNQFYR